MELSKAFNFPPSLLARSIVDKITNLPKKKISEAMRSPIEKLNDIDIILEQYLQSETKFANKKYDIIDPFSGEVIEYPQSKKISRLAKEVQEAICMDPLYGPRSDRERQIIGLEYELILEQTLRSMSKYS